MTFSPIVDFRASILPRWQDSLCWWHLAAASAYCTGRYEVIEELGEAYLFRAFLNGGQMRPRGGRDTSFCSLLHWIIRPDLGRGLHNHPWSFRTTILSGGYTEEVPANGATAEIWMRSGPDQIASRAYSAGDIIDHADGDLHRIAAVKPETWTIVTTGARAPRPWGFFAPGQPFRQATPPAEPMAIR